MTETTKTHEINKRNLPRLERRVERLRRKAEKYGLPLPSFTVVREWMRDEYSGEGPTAHATGVVIPMVTVEINGESPRLQGGWRLAAVVDHRIVPHEDLGWPIYSVEDGLEIPSRFHTESPWCDHCNLVRDRAETFLILSDHGEWRRVGRQCLKDFLAGVPLHAYAAYLYDLPQLAFGLDDDDEHHRGHAFLDTETYIAHVIAVIEKHGWLSRSAAYNSTKPLQATADTALDHLADQQEVSDHHRDQARAALDWARDELANGDDLNEYEYNLVIAASQQATREDRVGLVASLPHAYQRELLDRALADESNSTHQGEIGKRLDLTLTVTKRLDIEVAGYTGGYEVLKVHVMQDGDGNVYVWKTTSQKLAEHETYRLRGTVKSHDDYKGIPQTTLTRCSKIVHDPCGEFDYWFDKDGSYHCAACGAS